MSTPKVASTRPSDLRRKALNEELSVPLVSNFFPIERYYDAADKVYQSFHQTVQQKDALDDAYVYGKRYCTFCIEAIPTHNYYQSQKYKALKQRHTKQVAKVIALLEQVADRMDQEELEKQRQETIQRKKQAQEREKLEQRRYEELQKRVLRTTGRPKTQQPVSGDVEQSALSKLEMLHRQSSKPRMEMATGRVHSNDYRIPRDPSGDDGDQEQEELKGAPSSRYRLMLDSDEDDQDELKISNGTPLPPPIQPPGEENGLPPPPSYDHVTKRSAHYHRKFLGPAAPDKRPIMVNSGLLPDESPLLHFERPEEPKPKRRERIPMRQLQEQYKRDYMKYQQTRKIVVSSLSTYQGRIGASTNGCTVISALVAATHLASHGGVTDTQIVQVIDRQCGPILREIRGKLGLDGHALIIPSDVHDHLVDRKILKQKDFIGAAGGNIVDPDHIGEFIKLLSVGEDGKGASRKAAATLFFREHVISIVKCPVGQNQSFYDLVDSLPNMSNGGMATRTRCSNVESLEVLLRWYASRKFSDSNCSHIDRNAWDDNLADFDPRVFQGFVWATS